MSTSGDPAPVLLASASPRRRELLERVGLALEVVPADVDESPLPGESAEDYVVRVAADKAHAVHSSRRDRVVLAADTAVVLDGVPLGKPVDDEHALDLLERLAPPMEAHLIDLSVVVLDAGGIEQVTLARAGVSMVPSTDAERRWYVASGEPADKAGAYAVQGLGAALVEHVEGDPTTVIGLPLRATLELLRVAGVQWPPEPRG